MGRLEHASIRAALIYQHRIMTRERDIAEALDALIEQGSHDFARSGAEPQPSVTSGAAIPELTSCKYSGAGDENRTRMASLPKP
jgi:hypothetical protein